MPQLSQNTQVLLLPAIPQLWPCICQGILVVAPQRTIIFTVWTALPPLPVYKVSLRISVRGTPEVIPLLLGAVGVLAPFKDERELTGSIGHRTIFRQARRLGCRCWPWSCGL